MMTDKLTKILDEIVEIDVLTQELMKTPIAKELERLIIKREKMVECASKMIVEYDSNICQSTDGTIVATKKTLHPSIPFKNIEDSGLAKVIIEEYPEYVTISSTIRNTAVGDINGFANEPAKTIGIITSDDDYKFIRTKILQSANKRPTAPRSQVSNPF